MVFRSSMERRSVINVSANRNLVMDCLRGLASASVVVFHLNVVIPYRPTSWQYLCRYGWLGVPVFFAISGWCMGIIVQRRPESSRFILARLTRIFLPYWGSLLIMIGVIVIRWGVLGVNDVSPLPHSLFGVLATFALATKPVTSLAPMNWVYWSLSYEIAFYLLVYFGLMIRFPGVVLLISLLATLLPDASLPMFTSINPLFWTNQYPLFAMGFFGFLATCSSKHLLSCLTALGVAIHSMSLPVCTTGFLSIIVLALGNRYHPDVEGLRFVKGLERLGLWSYSLYLIHVPIGCYLILGLRSAFVLRHQWIHMFFDLGTLLLCIAFAAGFYHCLEKPSHDLAKWIGYCRKHTFLGLRGRKARI
jgi:peptidoglycan/LPS O-acetylase OafA/YrhL